MNLTHYYTKSTIYPSLVSIFITTIYSYNVNRSYKSEWLTSDAVTFYAMMTAFAYAIIMCLLSLTIFFNKHERIYKNSISRLLSWFLLPFGFIVIVMISNIRLLMSGQAEDRLDFIFYVVLNIPFMVALSWNYIRFSREVMLVSQQAATRDDTNP